MALTPNKTLVSHFCKWTWSIPSRGQRYDKHWHLGIEREIQYCHQLADGQYLLHQGFFQNILLQCCQWTGFHDLCKKTENPLAHGSADELPSYRPTYRQGPVNRLTKAERDHLNQHLILTDNSGTQGLLSFSSVWTKLIWHTFSGPSCS